MKHISEVMDQSEWLNGILEGIEERKAMSERRVEAEVVVGPDDDETTLEAVLLRVLMTRAQALPTAHALGPDRWMRHEDVQLPDGRILARASALVVPLWPEPKTKPTSKKGARR